MSLTRRFNTVGAILCALLAGLSGYVALTMRWNQGVDFDIIGFFWLIANIPQLFVCTVALASFGGAVVLGLRAWWDV